MTITANIKMGEHYETMVHGKTIEEVLEKIKDYHTMTPFMKEHYTKKGRLKAELKTGWYMKENT